MRKLDSIFEKYGLGKNVQEQYPFELSGGMTRRVMNLNSSDRNSKSW